MFANMRSTRPQPNAGASSAFVAASWSSLLLGTLGFVTGLWNAKTLAMSEKGFYFAVLVLGLYAAVSLQKAVRDRLEGIAVTGLYLGLSWTAVGTALLMLTVGLWNADIALAEKGFYGMAFALSLFAAVAVQKNVRDRLAAPPDTVAAHDEA